MHINVDENSLHVCIFLRIYIRKDKDNTIYSNSLSTICVIYVNAINLFVKIEIRYISVPFVNIPIQTWHILFDLLYIPISKKEECNNYIYEYRRIKKNNDKIYGDKREEKID